MNPWNILFPFQKYMKNFTGSHSAKDMEDYMSKMLKNLHNGDFGQMMNAAAAANSTTDTDQTNTNNNQQGKLPATIFESHSDIFVRLSMENSDLLKNIKIVHTSNLLIVEGIPEQTDRNTYTLPAIVKKKGSTAVYKDGALEIKLPKINDLQYSEINITEI